MDDVMIEFDNFVEIDQPLINQNLPKEHAFEDYIFEFDMLHGVTNQQDTQNFGPMEEQVDRLIELQDQQPVQNMEELQITEHLEPLSQEEPKLKLTDLSSVDVVGSLVNVVTKTLKELEDLYRKHSRHLGFSVRKSTIRRQNGVICDRYLICSCAGLKNVPAQRLTPTDCSHKKKKKNTKPKMFSTFRCNCRAQIRILRDEETGFFFVKHHVTFHNHNMTRLEWQHFHRSERRIDEDKAKLIESFEGAGIRPTESYNYMSHEAGGDEFVGHEIEDHMNFVNRLRMKMIEGGDSRKVIELLEEQSQKDTGFYYNLRVNDENKVIALFWCDFMMIEDFNIYGDVLIFDTTYRTNKYNLICAPFVGINNHWSNVMFGCAFICDEKIPTFEWLLSCFKRAMGGKSPKSIFTDQDLSISSAIEKVFPESQHRLCLWHLLQNACGHYGSQKEDDEFKAALNKCLSGCVDEDEFETTWENMMVDFDIRKDPKFCAWFDRLYNLRHKWCTALNKDFFSAGILSSQRSESTNNALGFQANKSTSLTQFYSIFQRTIKRWRRREQKLEFDCSKNIPSSNYKLVGLIKHAAEVYTATLFRDFEEEFGAGIFCTSNLVSDDASTKVYQVCDPGHSKPVHNVTYKNTNDDITITCSCRNFEEQGWLCCHVLRILNINSIQKIPQKYILSRWTKMAKKEVWEKYYEDGKPGEAPPKKNVILPWRHDMGRKYFSLILKASENAETRVIVEQLYQQIVQQVDEAIPKDDDEVSTPNSKFTARRPLPTIIDPDKVVTKGRSKRIKGHYDKRKKRSSSTTFKEFGTKTRNQHLF